METQSTRATQKALLTRQRILDTALSLFVSKGYEKTTMREIATEAGCSLGLAYRYFASKEELVLELYRNLVAQLEEQANQLAPDSIAERFQHIIVRQFELMTPHRKTLGAMFGPALNPQTPAGVFGANTSDVRRQARDIYIKIVSGSRDAPRGVQIEEMATNSLWHAVGTHAFLAARPESRYAKDRRIYHIPARHAGSDPPTLAAPSRL